MNIRTFQRGDEAAQVSIYNEAAGELPKFKPATLDEIRRRFRGADFDPSTHYFATDDDLVIGYATYHLNGRVSYPWCRSGSEHAAEPLFQAVLDGLRARGLGRAFAAYRGDWQPTRDFFVAHGFPQVREMVNFVMDLVEMPTPAARSSSAITPMRAEDVPAVFELVPEALRVRTPAELEQHLLHNPYVSAENVFIQRSRADAQPVAAGLLVLNDAYADPYQVDSAMPCFRCGAFGTEGMQVKRIKGLFSFVAKNTNSVNAFGLDLMAHAAIRLQDTPVETFAAQVPSDVPHLYRFYQQFFRRQGSFPVFETEL